ncbi:MAG: hypothetical protein KDI36_02330 [Pseudomonadales bacterium]|nr:hypothetical protein [Pseudomonadales bacterium]
MHMDSAIDLNGFESCAICEPLSDELAGRFLAFTTARALKPRTCDYYAYLMDISLPGWRNQTFSGLDYQLLQKRLQTVSPSTAEGCLRVWRAFFRFFNVSVSRFDEMAGSLRRARLQSREDFIPDEQLKTWFQATRLLPFCRDLPRNQRQQARSMSRMLQLQLLTGWRWDCITQLQWQALDLNAKTATLDGKCLPLSGIAVKLLRDQRLVVGESLWVFPSPSDAHIRTNRRWRARLDRMLGCHIDNHTIRRTFMHQCARLRISQPVRQTLAGYVTARPVDEGQLREAIDRIEARFLELLDDCH